MDLFIILAVMAASITASLVLGISILVPLLLGAVGFVVASLRRGFKLKEIWNMSLSGVKDGRVILEILVLIGCMTGLWRCAGTVSYFAYYGIELITPYTFIILTFLINAIISFVLGTSFGVAGTVGVIMMTIGTTGGVNPLITAGAVMSGVYFGDRCSPASSSANLVASLTDTDIYDNVRLMFKTAVLPTIITIAFYGYLSYDNPLLIVDKSILEALSHDLVLSPWCMFPAVVMMLLVVLKVPIQQTMSVSIVAALAVAVFEQDMRMYDAIGAALLGYRPAADSAMAEILSGGGLVSMITIMGIVIVSGVYSGICEGTHMLAKIEEIIDKKSRVYGRFSMMILTSLGACAVFCNQTVGILMCNQLLKDTYSEGEAPNKEIMIDMENSVVIGSALIPWTISCSVPLAMLGVDFRTLPYCILLYIIPVCYFFTKKYTKIR